jgi:hypothetical protein
MRLARTRILSAGHAGCEAGVPSDFCNKIGTRPTELGGETSPSADEGATDATLLDGYDATAFTAASFGARPPALGVEVEGRSKAAWRPRAVLHRQSALLTLA